MTNDAPPRACLADFGFTTMVFDPQNPMSSSHTLEGGTLAFMAPELLAPSRFGLEGAVPTQEADIYAFGLVILQVSLLYCCHLLSFLTFCQVLIGRQPFPDMKLPELVFRVSSGLRPEKPANAEVIGVSDSLWELIEKCWVDDRMRRPQIEEVVAGVGDAAAKWNKDMPPSDVEPRQETAEDDSDELEHGEFSLLPIVLVFLRHSV